MPPDLLEVEEFAEPVNDVSRPRTLTFKRDSRPEDWERFESYAPFVQQMGFVNQRNSSLTTTLILSHKICRALAQKSLQKMLLPALRSVIVATNDLPYIAFFLTPHVRTIKLLAHPNFITALSMLAAEIPSRSPNVEKLQLVETTGIWKPGQKTMLKPALSKLLYAMNLQEFTCDFIEFDEELLSCLLAMPRLSAVSIEAGMLVLKQALLKQRLRRSQIASFSLYCKTNEKDALPAIASLLRPSNLGALRIIVTAAANHLSAEELSDFFRAIGRECSSALTEVLLDTSGTQPHQPILESAVITFDMIKHILPFSHLRNVTFFAHPLDLNDEEIKQLAMSWPALEGLIVETNPFTNLPPRTSLRGLLWLAAYCRKLDFLEYRFNDALGDVLPGEFAGAVNHSLRFLSVGSSPIENPGKVASFLNGVFPALSLIMFSHPSDVGDVNWQRWSEVEAQIQQP